ncbi:MAG: GNAT family N-acetyltransferase [Pseudomonadota bacterium]
MATPQPINAHVVLRDATLEDAALLVHWDQQPHVISATTDDPNATDAFEGICWPDELAAQNKHSHYVIAELSGRPIGAMQIIDPHEEPTHYWGDIAANLRALDIWIGETDCLGKGYGESMMRLAFMRCFSDPQVTAIMIDPLNSNTRAHRFYQRLGFEVVGRRQFDDDDCLVHKLRRQVWHKLFGSDAS